MKSSTSLLLVVLCCAFIGIIVAQGSAFHNRFHSKTLKQHPQQYPSFKQQQQQQMPRKTHGDLDTTHKLTSMATFDEDVVDSKYSRLSYAIPKTIKEYNLQPIKTFNLQDFIDNDISPYKPGNTFWKPSQSTFSGSYDIWEEEDDEEQDELQGFTGWFAGLAHWMGFEEDSDEVQSFVPSNTKLAPSKQTTLLFNNTSIKNRPYVPLKRSLDNQPIDNTFGITIHDIVDEFENELQGGLISTKGRVECDKNGLCTIYQQHPIYTASKSRAMPPPPVSNRD